MTKLRFTKKFEIELDSNKLKWFYMSCAAALPQLDRGSDYESERHRFESYTPHQSKSKASGNGGFSFTAAPHGFGLIGQNVCPRWGHRRRSMPLFQPFKFGARF